MALKQEQRKVVTALSLEFNVPPAWSLAIIDKESSGVDFYKVTHKGLVCTIPCIYIEGHYFYKYLDGYARQQAVEKGLAAKKARVVKNPVKMQNRWAQFLEMADIDKEAAYKSISMGVGQTMGDHYKAYGFASASDMFNFACVSFKNQVWLMLKEITKNPNLVRAIRDRDFVAFAKGYNGPAAPPSYARDIERLVTSYESGSVGNTGDTSLDLDIERIKKLGFSTVEEFQTAHGLVVDGIVGPATKDAIDVAEQAKRDKALGPVKKCIKVAAGGAGTVIVGTAADNAEAVTDAVTTTVDVVTQAGPLLTTLYQSAPLLLVAVGVGVAGWFLFKAWKHYRNAVAE